MKQFLSAVSIIVADYDEAIDYYTNKLGFELIDDIDQGDELHKHKKRWVTVQPKGASESQIVLAKPGNKEQENYIGRQGGGRVWLFLQTDDFYRDHKIMLANGVHFLEEPREEPYGTVVVFEDLYGNKWDLLELKN